MLQVSNNHGLCLYIYILRNRHIITSRFGIPPLARLCAFFYLGYRATITALLFSQNIQIQTEYGCQNGNCRE